MSQPNPYRALPSVDDLTGEHRGRLPHPLLVEAARSVLAAAREQISDGVDPETHYEMDRQVRALERSAGTIVINATGVLLHTNLGRSRWSDVAASRALSAATGHTNVELDLESGERSRRGSYVKHLLGALTGAADALVVNNNAAALLLALAATSAGRGVPVARGELIEIGGAYRLPDVMHASGARLVEVGTTNRTRVGDYQTALQLNECGSILKVHPSNYKIEGFTEDVEVSGLAALATADGIPLIYDIGSGLLDSSTPWLPGPTPDWLRGEPAARQALEDGADLVMFSGDKLLGGPQAGIVVGSEAVVGRLRRHPLARALRVDGVTLAGLAATLEAYAENEALTLPFWRQALMDRSLLETRAEAMAEALGGTTADAVSAIGAGSVPGMEIPTTVVVLEGEDHLYGLLLDSDRPILARRDEGSLVLDLRTVDPESDSVIVETVQRCR